MTLQGTVRLIFLVVGLGSALNSVAASDLQKSLTSAAEESLACGPRACFVVGCAQGLDWTYEECRELLPVGSSRGTSLQRIQRVLRHQGVSCRVRALSPSELPDVEGSVIVHFGTGYTGRETGHFMVIEKMTPRGPQLMDPISGTVEVYEWNEFSDTWSGYCLVADIPSQSPTATRNSLSMLGLINICGVILLLCPCFLERRRFHVRTEHPET